MTPPRRLIRVRVRIRSHHHHHPNRHRDAFLKPRLHTSSSVSSFHLSHPTTHDNEKTRVRMNESLSLSTTPQSSQYSVKSLSSIPVGWSGGLCDAAEGLARDLVAPGGSLDWAGKSGILEYAPQGAIDASR